MRGDNALPYAPDQGVCIARRITLQGARTARLGTELDGSPQSNGKRRSEMIRRANGPLGNRGQKAHRPQAWSDRFEHGAMHGPMRPTRAHSAAMGQPSAARRRAAR